MGGDAFCDMVKTNGLKGQEAHSPGQRPVYVMSIIYALLPMIFCKQI